MILVLRIKRPDGSGWEVQLYGRTDQDEEDVKSALEKGDLTLTLELSDGGLWGPGELCSTSYLEGLRNEE